MKTKIQFTNENTKELYNGKLEYATEGSAGFDLRACRFDFKGFDRETLAIEDELEFFVFNNKDFRLSGTVGESQLGAILTSSASDDMERLENNVYGLILELKPQGIIKIGTGVKIQPSQGYATFVYPRSGFSTKNEVILLNGVGVIDSDYTGEIIVCLKNISNKPVEIALGDKIAQAVIQPVLQAHFEYVEELEPTKRGDGGFGSTGK